MNAFRTLLILVASLAVTAHSQQPKPTSNILQGKSIEELRKIAENLGEGKSSFEFVDAAYASGRDDLVALCWSLNSCNHWCCQRMMESRDPVFRGKQMLMMLRDGGRSNLWLDGYTMLDGRRAMLMEHLGRVLTDYFPVWTIDYTLLDSPEKRLAFADKLEALMKAKQQQSAKPTPNPVPAAVVPPNPAPPTASPPKAQLSVVTPPLEGQEPVAWIPWVSVAALVLLIVGFLVRRRRK
ncbi:hypothetical protein [Prosthecobacter sp.]|uniref:hypothetical protein n=1 Tax=Prosthecobacter sp. TaxID=1965333 RepID=UPI003783CF1D